MLVNRGAGFLFAQERRVGEVATVSPEAVVPAKAGTQRDATDCRDKAAYAKPGATPSLCWRTGALGSCFHRNDG